MAVDLADLYQCPYCGYTSETGEFFEGGDPEEPICPDCGEDLSGELAYPTGLDEEEEL